MNFGLTDNAINFILTAISKKRSIVQIQKSLNKGDKSIQKMGTAHGTRQSLSGRLGRLLSGGYFNDDYDTFDLFKHWYKGNQKKRKSEVPILTFKGVEPAWMSSVYHKTLVKTMKFCINNNIADPKLFFVDDAQLVCGSEMDNETSSIITTKNSLEIWRKFGINMMFATQRPEAINPVVPSMAKWIFCSRVNDLSFLRGRTSFDKTLIQKIASLKYEPERNLVQWIMVYPNQYKFKTYYPFFCRQAMSV